MTKLDKHEKHQSIRNTIRQNYRQSEEEAVARLLPLCDIPGSVIARVHSKARELAIEIRSLQGKKSSVDVLLQEFSLSSEEGVLLMCLAEALLRIPDTHTQDQLIRDKLLGGDWSAHLKGGSSMFVNASAWGLLLTGKVVSLKQVEGLKGDTAERQWSMLRNTIARLGEPVIRMAMNTAIRIMSTQFVLGEDFDSALINSRSEILKGYTYSYDMLGEGARTSTDADRHMVAYEQALKKIAQTADGQGPIERPGLSVKLSAIHPRFEFAQRDRVMRELVPRLKKLALQAKALDIGLTIDAEEAERLDLTLDIVEAVFSDPELGDWSGLGLAIQSYQKSAIDVVDWAISLAQIEAKRIMVRLVKGAYWDSEIKHNQVEGYSDYPVFTRKPATDLCFLTCAKKLLEHRGLVYPQFATHNALTAAAVLELAREPSITGDMDFEFQRLHGMGDVLFDRLLADKEARCRIYAPVGIHQDLLAYLVRRILENGANSSFVNNIVDESVAIDDLLRDPVEEIKDSHPRLNPAIPLPARLFGDSRANSTGLDLTDKDSVASVQQVLDNCRKARPVVESSQVRVVNPANTDDLIGGYRNCSRDEMLQKLELVTSGMESWSGASVDYRAGCLERLAQLLEANRNELVALCTREAGRTLDDSVAEVREAVDFCYYYALQARLAMDESGDAEPDLVQAGQKAQEPLGVVLCISPWNFPLAIFLGQISAALVAGNTVLGKPAEQTTLVALRTTGLMREAGITEEVFQLITGPGKAAGEVLVADQRIGGVMFTGSTETALWIARELARRDGVPARLIAETGGQNAMIVDSTALPEAVVDDVIMSGFKSAGQRCSSLRVLFVQEEIADKIVDMLRGAMQELVIGDPSVLSSDIGPVIDARALSVLEQHQDRMKRVANLLYQCEIPATTDKGHFYGPVLYELDDISVLEREVFGPAVHVIRYAATELDQVIDSINGTGYGLTLGIHTRIESKAEYIAQHVKVGNVYINRNMIGAVVGVQPFGGCGLSGTGPKAGGPHYLSSLQREPAGSLVGEQDQDSPASSFNHFLRSPFETPQSEAAATELNALMGEALEGIERDMGTRAECLEHYLASLGHSKQGRLIELEIRSNISRIARACLTRVVNIVKESVDLRGATGESNELIWEPRGNVVCLCTSEQHDWIQSLLVALLTGNRAILGCEPEQVNLACQIVASLIEAGFSEKSFQVIGLYEQSELISILNHALVDAVAVNTRDATGVARQIRQRQGALIPLLTGGLSDNYVHGFMREKTITINTTAAGGNASLLIAASDPTLESIEASRFVA
jgi:RHH-type proline utilization regulon transcriptional repressor/proline dehydrogenase/delta 1-pyrroline-5-carboxylate dehydrogenase